MTYVKVKGQSRSNVVKNVLLLPTLARRITKQVKDDDDLYEGQRSTEVISGQGTCHRDDAVMSSFKLGHFHSKVITLTFQIPLLPHCVPTCPHEVYIWQQFLAYCNKIFRVLDIWVSPGSTIFCKEQAYLK